MWRASVFSVNDLNVRSLSGCDCRNEIGVRVLFNTSGFCTLTRCFLCEKSSQVTAANGSQIAIIGRVSLNIETHSFMVPKISKRRRLMHGLSKHGDPVTIFNRYLNLLTPHTQSVMKYGGAANHKCPSVGSRGNKSTVSVTKKVVKLRGAN